jgi:hypothetical protein
MAVCMQYEDLRESRKLACSYRFSARVPEASRAISARTLHLKILLIRARIGFDRGENNSTNFV